MNEKMSNSGFDLNFLDDLCDEHFSHTCLSFVYFILKNVPYPLIIDFSGFLFSYCNSLHILIPCHIVIRQSFFYFTSCLYTCLLFSLCAESALQFDVILFHFCFYILNFWVSLRKHLHVTPSLPLP